MKHAAPCLLAVALMSPAALADTPKSQPIPYAIVVDSAVTPLTHVAFRYPHKAADRGMDGSCDVAFAITPSGRAEKIQVASCSSELFENAARAVVSGMTFDATGQHVRNVSATIRWDLLPQQYASLN